MLNAFFGLITIGEPGEAYRGVLFKVQNNANKKVLETYKLRPL
jgi:hypothetical protein